MRPTSPRGSMPRPMSALSPGAPMAPSGDSSFPTTATTRRIAGVAEHRALDEGADVGVDADLQEEHRDEQVADRAELAADALGLAAPGQRDAGHERTDDRGQLGGVGQLGERRA